MSELSHRDEGCKLRMMRNRPASWMIAALLMFQLVIGMQWQVAHVLSAADAICDLRAASHGHSL
jgi:hypothetical protein